MANQEATFSAAGSETQQQALPSSAPTPTTITLASPEDEVKAVMSNLGFLSGAKLTEDLAGVDGEMLLQMTTPATCKELLPSINPRQSVLLAAKIRAWATGRTAAAHAEAVRSAPRSPQQTNEGRGRPLAIDDTRRSRSRSRTPRRNQPSSGSADHTGTGQSMLRNFVAQILTAGEDEDNEQADEQIANKLEELKQIAGPINPESLPPKQVMKRILSLKRKGKGGAPPEYVELKKFLPAVAGPAGGQDQGAINSMSMMAMGLAYVLSGHWNLGHMLTYVGTVTKIAASDGWQTAINYDTMARKRWAAQVLTDDRRQATLDGFLDLHVLDQARTLVRRQTLHQAGQPNTRATQGWRQVAMREGLCLGFSREGPRGCPKGNGTCRYHHRCGLCRSQYHGTAQHKKQQPHDQGRTTAAGSGTSSQGDHQRRQQAQNAGGKPGNQQSKH